MRISAASNPMNQFTGKERDAETGLDYFLARYYSGAQGRSLSPDEFKGGIVDPFTGQQVSQPGPLPYADITDPQTLNKYGYVRNNPLRYIDPDGHIFEEFWAKLSTIFSSYFNSKVNVIIDEPKAEAPSPIVNGDKVIEATVDGLVKGSDVVSTTISTLDPTGAASVVQSYMKGDKTGTVIGLAGMALGGKGSKECYGIRKAFVQARGRNGSTR
jgi:RHS repeat-associated protein